MSTNPFPVKKTFDCYECEDGQLSESCQECCQHSWDYSIGGACEFCGREDAYNFVDEDYGQDR